MDEEAILGGLRSGEDLPDYDYEEFTGSAGQDRRGDDPDRDTPRSRGRYTDDGDDRIFRDEQGRGARPDRGGSESGFGSPRTTWKPCLVDLPGLFFQVNHRPWKARTMVLAPRDILGRLTGSQNPGQFDEHEERAFA